MGDTFFVLLIKPSYVILPRVPALIPHLLFLWAHTNTHTHITISFLVRCWFAFFQSHPLIHPLMVPQGSYNKLTQRLRGPEKVSGTLSPKHTHRHMRTHTHTLLQNPISSRWGEKRKRLHGSNTQLVCSARTHTHVLMLSFTFCISQQN